MNILVINCGSSSLKYQVIDSETEQVKAKGLCERIGIDGRLVYQPAGGEKETSDIPMPTHKEAVASVIAALTDANKGVLKSLDEIDAVGHRFVHGGEKFTKSTLLDDAALKELESVCDLAPLHNPAHIIGVNACRDLMPNTPQVAVFDTAFHQTMPQKAYMYAVPYAMYEKHGVRKYGFHGTSHKFVSGVAAEAAGVDYNNSKIIVCHLGNGASICAVKNGQSVDTSMGLSPLEGLIMGTRSGDIDASAVEYMAKKENMSLSEVLTMLNKKSGVDGVSGVSSDFRDLKAAAAEGNDRAKLALDMFHYRVAKYIGSYIAGMNGVDVIAFTAGLGENNAESRKEICDYLEWMGVKIDDEANSKRADINKISAADSRVQVFVVATNEELMIARDTAALAK